MNAVRSPCVKVCAMDPARGLCRGCWRTLDEIARWGALHDRERERIMAALPARRHKVESEEIPDGGDAPGLPAA